MLSILGLGTKVNNNLSKCKLQKSEVKDYWTSWFLRFVRWNLVIQPSWPDEEQSRVWVVLALGHGVPVRFTRLLTPQVCEEILETPIWCKNDGRRTWRCINVVDSRDCAHGVYVPWVLWTFKKRVGKEQWVPTVPVKTLDVHVVWASLHYELNEGLKLGIMQEVSLAIGCLTILVEFWVKSLRWPSKNLV